MSRAEKMREHMKSLAVGVLLVILICLCVIYILDFSGVKAYDFTKDDMESVSSESVRYQYLDHWDVSFVSPSFIGFSAKNRGDNIGFYTLGGENAEIYREVLPLLEVLFADGSAEAMDAAEGEALFKNLLRGDYIYLSYACDLPTALLLAMSHDDASGDGDMGEFVSEVLIVPEVYLGEASYEDAAGVAERLSVYSFYAVARDGSGNYYRYRTAPAEDDKRDILFHTNFYRTYTIKENALPYEFACLWKEDSFLEKHDFREKISDTTVIPLSHAVYETPIVFAESRIPGGNDKNEILDIFYMNPEKISSYTDETGVIFYFDEGRNISISPSGRMQFTSLGAEGISLEELFGGRSTNGEYTVFDYIGASLMESALLKKAHNQTNCALYISGISHDGTLLKISFGYAVGGMPLYFDGSADVLSFSFSSGMLEAAEYHFWTVHKTALVSRTPDFLWALRSRLLSDEGREEYFYGYYFTKNRTRTGADILGIPKP